MWGKNIKRKIIFLVPLVFGFALIFFLSQLGLSGQIKISSDNQSEQTSAQLEKHNQDISSQTKGSRQNQLSPQKKAEIIQTLTQRKNLLLQEIEKDPSAIKKYALSQAIKDSLPEEAKELVEYDIETKGKLTVFIADDIKNKKSKTAYQLEDSKKYNIKFIDKPRGLKSADNVTVQGLALDSTLVLDSGSAPSLTLNSPPRKGLVGPQNSLVIRFNWRNDASTPFSASDINTQLYSGAGSTNTFYQENSYGQFSFPGDTTHITTSWYTIPYDKGSGCSYTDIGNWTDAANAAATAPPDSYDLNSYNNIIYLFSYNPSCGWAGLGEVPGDQTWINGYNNSSLFSHELGHNVGEGHADTLDCGAKPVDSYSYQYNPSYNIYEVQSGNCSWDEYGDDYDVMGGSWENYHYNAAFKEDAGWITPGEIQTISTAGTYTLNTLENAGSATKAIKIQKPDTSEYYWLEYRQASGFDSTLPVGVTRGAVIHIDSSLVGDTFLLDATTANGWSDVALSDGATFTDSINNISVTQVSHNATSVTLSVSFSPPPPPPPPPPPAVSPVYRFYNKTNGTHFYTASEAEKNNIMARWPNIYKFEGFAYNVSAYPTSAAVYRFWNKNGTHFYTVSEAEKNNIMARWGYIFKYEGLAYYVSPYPTNNNVYRFYNKTNGTHFFTASASERDNIIRRWGYIYRYEGTAWFLP